MSKKKITLIIIILLVIGGLILASTTSYGEYDTTERAKLEIQYDGTGGGQSDIGASFMKTATPDSVVLKSFSTKDYASQGVVRASLFLYTNNPTVNIEVEDGTTSLTDVYNGNLQIPDIGAGAVTTTNKKEEATIETINTDKPAGVDGNKGYFHYWIQITYKLPDSILSGRTAAIKFINIGSTTITVKNYYLAEIQEKFIDPSPDVPDSSRYLVRKNGKISLSAKASYRTVQGIFYPDSSGDITTTIDGKKTTFQETSSSKLGDISRGDFKITATGLSDLGPTLASLSQLSDGWYQADGNVNYNNTWKNATGIRVWFRACANTIEGKWISLPIAGIVEGDAPKITDISLTNTTLSTFMSGLKTTDGVSLSNTFSSSTIEDATVSTQNSDTGITSLKSDQLNVKDKDNIDVEFTIDDESIIKDGTDQIVQVKYGGITYDASWQSNIGTQSTKWKVKIVYDKSLTNQTLTFNIKDSSKISYTDDSGNEITGNKTVVDGTPFIEPALLGTTKMAPHEDNPAGSTYKNYYSNNGVLNVETKPTGALAYIAMFDYDKTQSDKDSSYSYLYPTDNTVNWISSNDGTFKFGDGYYKYAKVYIVNKAGAISEITYDGTLDNALKTIIGNARTPDFYVDTVAPRVSNYEFYKFEDKNKNDFSETYAKALYDNLLIGINKPYKTGDGVEIKATVKEYNMAETKEVSGIVGWNVIPTSGIYDIVNGSTYEKAGTALDLTVATGVVNNKIVSTFYDKAGNSFEPNSIPIVFDDRIPSSLNTKAVIGKDITKGNNYKYTNNSNLPLEIITGVPLSVAFVKHYVSDETTAKTHVGNVTGANTSSIDLSSFSGFESAKNSMNNLDVTTYSHSGEKGTQTSDSIVLDTEINDSQGSIVNSNYTTEGSYNIFNLNTLLDSVTELVGLESFTVTKTGIGSNAKISDVGTEKALGTIVSLGDYSTYNEILTPTSYSGLSPARLYKLKVPKGITGKMTYRVTLKDRLGNSKNISYTVVVTNNVNIVGKVKNSSNTINTKISNGNKMKIESRTE